MLNSPSLADLIDGDAVTRWIGEKRHIIAYPIAGKKIYNVSTVQPDTNFAGAPGATYTTCGFKSEMLNVFGGFCPRIREMLDLVGADEVCEWKLRVHDPLPNWVVRNIALLGDAVHPTLPHLAQGAAMAVEDAAVLAVVLDRAGDLLAPDKESSEGGSGGEEISRVIHRALKVYEGVRKPRAEMMVELAAESGRELHLGAGEKREDRDRAFKEEGRVPDKWADKEVQRVVYGVDVGWDAEEATDGEASGATRAKMRGNPDAGAHKFPGYTSSRPKVGRNED